MTIAVGPWLWAVHISDGVLGAGWVWAGFAVAAALAVFGAWRIRDEEIPQVAVLTAAFFVASLIHVRIGLTSAHLLLNGLLGAVIGTRACLAIPVGLLLQAALMAHGGFSTLGVNSCVMALPALAAGWLLAAMQTAGWLRKPLFRSGLVLVTLAAWGCSVIYALALLATSRTDETGVALASATQIMLHPASLAGVFLFAGCGTWAERRLETAPEFPLGLLVGTITVLLTLLLNWLVLVQGGREDWRTLALLLFATHLPIAAIEGVIVGFALGFLARVKPQMIGLCATEKQECPADALA